MTVKKKHKSVTAFQHKDVTPDEMKEGKKSEGVRLFFNEYDKNDNLLVEAEYSGSGEETSRSVSKYTGNNLTEEEQYIDGELTERKTYEHENNRLIREKTHYLDSSFDVETYTCDSEGNVITKELKNFDGELETTEKFTYLNKLLTEHTVFDAENNLINKITHKYSETRDIIETTEWNAENNRELRTVYGKNETVKEGYPDYVIYTQSGSIVQKKHTIFDTEGRLLKQQIDQYHAQGIVSYLTVNEWDEKGNLFITENYTNGALIQRAERFYDEENKLIMTQLSSAGEGISTILYEYEYFA